MLIVQDMSTDSSVIGEGVGIGLSIVIVFVILIKLSIKLCEWCCHCQLQFDDCRPVCVDHKAKHQQQLAASSLPSIVRIMTYCRRTNVVTCDITKYSTHHIGTMAALFQRMNELCPLGATWKAYDLFDVTADPTTEARTILDILATRVPLVFDETDRSILSITHLVLLYELP